ncbi:DNA alkylation repair protein [Leucobacter sp. CSA1]|uniref:DNA alkylation repair protein n=1 Tax=Leucobacter chromiisoli TaxID=2796471 RepID=A0A934UV33_9MICO|nr:DNA alkylation repair protein [Leucobacter chromiisoli]MBK0419046.1 DNA alkylation repair protein [Leucobacter chromiisoli]
MSMTDELLGAATAKALVDALEAAGGGRLDGTRRAAESLGALTLSERSRALARAILADLDGDRLRLLTTVRRAGDDPAFAGWMLWPVGLAVAWRSVEADSAEGFDAGMTTLRELTPRMTSEFAVRPMLLHDLPRALAHMAEWTGHDDWHVRRLASEGSRPLLPWAERIPALVADPTPTRRILDTLYDDLEESVRRSVANHLNDHSRAHAAFAVDTVTGWQATGGTHLARTSRHALRTLVKRGHTGALELLGFPPAQVAVSPLSVTPGAVAPGDAVRFRATVENTGGEAANLVIDYLLFFPDARGSERSKVFKIAQRRLLPGESTVVEASHAFRELTTRRYYPGSYGVALQVNGVVQERVAFSVGAAPAPRSPEE